VPSRSTRSLERSDHVQRPVQIQWAVVLLGLSLIAGFIAGAGEMAFGFAEEPEFEWLFLGVFFGSFVLMGIPIYFVWRRRNWARIVLLLLTIAGVATTFWLPPEGASFREWSMEIALTGADLLALYWLFTGSGAAWFSKRSEGAF
jgi:ABC-type Fe3+-siderophore transport system permease subunit